MNLGAILIYIFLIFDSFCLHNSVDWNTKPAFYLRLVLAMYWLLSLLSEGN